MPDWLAYVNERLGRLRLPEAESLQVREELAAHLEDTYFSLLKQGVPESEAVWLTCDLVSNWQELRRDILAAKSEAFMQNRVSQLWIPGLVTFFSSFVLLAVYQILGFPLFVIHPGEPSSIAIYVYWLLSLPLLGALGAYLSLRARGRGLAVHCASLFPALIMAAVLLAVFFVALVVDRHASFRIVTSAFAVGVLNGILLPGFFLLMGDFLLQFVMKRRAAPH